jgi:hypothetical protein
MDDSTGPVLAFTLVLYRTAQRLGLNFLPLYSWCVDLHPKSLDMASEKGRDSWQRECSTDVWEGVFLSGRVGIWTSLILFISSITSLSNIVKFFTRWGTLPIDYLIAMS